MQKTYIIAEMSANHGGSLDHALKIVKEAKKAGADCLKLQTYTADTLTLNCFNDYFKIHNGLWDEQYLYELYRTAATPWEWQPVIKKECEHVGLDFLSTPFDHTAVDFLCDLNVNAFKIASFEIVDLPLISYAASKGKTMILSCGMASKEEIQEALNTCKAAGNEDVILLKCCSEYPAQPEHMNLSTITDMRREYEVPIGLSDHSMGHLSALIACSLGACVIEKHFCLDRSIDTADSKFSMNPQEFSDMVQAIREVETAMGDVYYGVSATEVDSIIFRKSVFAAEDILPGESFTRKNIRIIRPGYGIAPKYYEKLLNRTAKREIKFGEPIQQIDLE